MQIPEYISTNVLNVFTPKSRAYISNVITRQLYWLKGEASDLWFIIINAKNDFEIIEYAKKNNLETELYEFIKELESQRINK